MISIHNFNISVGDILLETAGGRGATYLFRDPLRIWNTTDIDAVPRLLREVDEAVQDGFYVAGYLTYEAGLALEPALRSLVGENTSPLLWLGCYRERIVLESSEVVNAESSQKDAPSLQLSIGKEEYERKVDTIRERIARGDTYQANFTADVTWETDEEYFALYQHLRAVQPAAFSALVQLGDRQILSLSPELFFQRDGDRIVTRPMKGTAQRGMDTDGDRRNAAWLASDEKNRSENLMIVDLLRNDLGHICTPGSIKVDSLFDVEKLPSVLQMTSTVSGQLRAETSYLDIFKALFPSGSIVGAPKINTARILHELEGRPRGVYTGAIGFIAPDQKATFSVAIRTVELQGGKARMGVGSGIVYDSSPEGEYEECMTKTLFLSRPAEEISLIETMLFEGGRFPLLQKHLDRMQSSAEYFDLPFSRAGAEFAVEETTRASGCSNRQRVRLLLSKGEQYQVTVSPLPLASEPGHTVLLASELTDSSDRFLRHKSTRRKTYDRWFAKAQEMHFADAVFCNERDEWTEGCIHNLYFCIIGRWYTPPVECGVLPGVYRRFLLEKKMVEERVIVRSDLASIEAMYLGNSVRGLRRVQRLIAHEEGGQPKLLWSAAEDSPMLRAPSL